MNILFLIGNGFDLNLGMKTRYQDFNKFYSSRKSSNKLVQSLKDNIDSNFENWSDLEKELGKYTKNLKTSDEFIVVFEDLEDMLAEYLKDVEDKFEFNKIEGKKLFKFLVYPENSLTTADKNLVTVFRQKLSNTQWNIFLLTFNYTKSLEKLLNYDGKVIHVNEQITDNHPIVLQRVEHIHGFYDSRMVMGVNDVSQISNTDFHDNIEVLEALVKSDCNQAQKHRIDDWCKKQISSADLICIFGCSIGDTDNLWWELLGERLKHECRIIIFTKGDIIPPRRPQKGRIAERKWKKYFLDKTKLDDKEKSIADGKIFIGVNTNMFDII